VNDLLFVADRSLSPLGVLRLKDQRLLQSSWPNPLVYGAIELAERAERKLLSQKQSTGAIGPALEMLMAHLKKSPRGAFHLWKKQKTLWPLGLTLEAADGFRELLSRISEKEAPLWAELFWAHALLRAQKLEFSPWQKVEAFEAVLKQNLISKTDFAQLCAVPVAHQNSVRMDVPLTRELWPLEVRLLKVLPIEKNFIEAPEGRWNPKDLAQDTELASGSTLHWVSQSHSPGPLEWIAQVPSHTWVDFEFRESPCEDFAALVYRWLKNEALSAPQKKVLQDMNWPEKDSRDWVQSLLGFESMTWAKPERLVEWAFVLQELFAPQKTPLQVPRNIHPRGIPALTLEDLPWGLGNPMYLVGQLSDLEELCRPHSSLSESKAVFPMWLRTDLEKHCHIAVPDPVREAQWLQSWLAHWQSRIRRLGSPPPPHRIPAEAPPIEGPKLTKPLSASSLKSYQSCPRLYFLESLNRLNLDPEPDADRLHPMLYGKWIHDVLEQVVHILEPKPETLTEILKKTLGTHFQDRFASPDYRQLLESVAVEEAHKLHRWILQVEEPLVRPIVEAQGSLKHHKELSIQGLWRNRSFTAKLDRLDESQDRLWIWDYKTGSAPSGPWESLVKRALPQLPLYKALAEQHFGKTMAACGFLNPLKPDDSLIYIFEDHAPAVWVDSIQSLSESSGIKTRSVSAREAETCQKQLEELVDEVSEKLARGLYPAEPRDEKTCQSCRQAALCGKPVLTMDVTTDLAEDVKTKQRHPS